MKKSILIAFTGLFLFSCGITKKLQQKDNSTKDTTIERREITRPGDTITIDIPNIRYKDTVITRVNYEKKTIATVRYDEQGNQRFECLSAEIEESLESIKESVKNDIKSKKETKHQFNPQYIFYAIGALAFIVLIGLIFLSFLFMKMQKQIPTMTAKIIKEVIK